MQRHQIEKKMTAFLPGVWRRSAVPLVVLFAGALAAAAPSFAQDSRPLQVIVGYAPGGGTDTLARVLTVPLGKSLEKPVIVRNVPGAGGQIAATALLREGNVARRFSPSTIRIYTWQLDVKTRRTRLRTSRSSWLT